MMLRDHERSGPRFISPETEEKIESIIVGAWERINEFYNEKYRPGKNEETYGLRLKSWRDRVMGLSERSATEKAALLTELLTILHSGGTNMGLRNFTPSMSSLYGKYSTAGSDHNFLVGLNNLGNPSFWEQNPGVVSAIGKQ